MKRAWPFFALLGTLLAIFWPILIGGRTLYPSDILHELFLPFSASRTGTNVQVTSIIDYIPGYYPMRHFLQQSLRSGELPLWNPNIYGGHPAFASNGSTPTLDPFNLFLLLPNLPMALALRTFMQLCASAILMYLFLRHLRLSNVAAYIGAMGYTLNSMYYANIFDWALGGFLWLPLVLLLTDKAIETHLLRSIMFAGLSLGVCLLSSPIQPMAYILFIFIVFFSLRLISQEYQATRGSDFTVLASILLIGFLVACVQLLPSAELFYLARRGGAVSGRTLPQALLATLTLITFAFPGLGGQLKGGMLLAQAWGGETHSQGYIGFLPLLLALFAAFSWPDRHKRPLIILGGAAIVIVLYTPLRSFVYDRFFLVYIFSASVLSAYGMDALLMDRFDPIRARRLLKAIKVFLAAVVVSVALGSVLFLMFENPLRGRAHAYLKSIMEGRFLGTNLPLHIQKLDNTIDSLLISSPRMFLPLLIAFISVGLIHLKLKGRISLKYLSLAVVLLVALDLAFSAATHVPYVALNKYPLFPDTESITLIKQDSSLFRTATLFRPGKEAPIIYRSMLEPYGLQSIDGSDNVSSPWSLIKMIGTSGTAEYNIDAGPRQWNMQNVKYLLTSRSVELPSQQFELIYDKEVHIYRNLQVMPRAYLARGYEVLDDPRALKDRLNDPSFNYRETVLLEEDPQIPLSRFMNGEDDRAEIVNYQPQIVDIQTRSISPKILVLVDSYYPGWGATVDGRPTKVLRVNSCVRAVIVPSGNHRVRFAFKSASFRLGLWISSCTLIFAFFSIGLDLRRKQ
jgi:hypothetical protein